MRKYNHAEVAFLKTTQEPVFILNIEEKVDGPADVLVRRPVKGANGVEHKTEHFFEDEIATFEELVNVQLDQQESERKTYSAREEKVKVATAESGSNGPVLLN